MPFPGPHPFPLRPLPPGVQGASQAVAPSEKLCSNSIFLSFMITNAIAFVNSALLKHFVKEIYFFWKFGTTIFPRIDFYCYSQDQSLCKLTPLPKPLADADLPAGHDVPRPGVHPFLACRHTPSLVSRAM